MRGKYWARKLGYAGLHHAVALQHGMRRTYPDVAGLQQWIRLALFFELQVHTSESLVVFATPLET